MDLAKFCHLMPKIELHAHLNGSISRNTLEKLHKMQYPISDDRAMKIMNPKDCSSLEECFKIFDIAHALTNSPKAVFMATCDIIKEFKEDNVIYLELRSTPRAVQGSMTKEEYVEAIVEAIGTCETDIPEILVKLLISIDRKHGYESAEESIKLAMTFVKKYPKYVVGIDLSGDPSKGGAFLDLLESARKVGLKIAAHCAEISNEEEAMDILNFKPDRLGHCTCIHPNLNGTTALFDRLLNLKIPVELCLTSNVICKTVPSYTSHQFKYLYQAGHPICLSTDDKGVFNTTLSKEFELAASNFGLERNELMNLSKSSVHYAFARLQEQDALLVRLKMFE